MHALERVRVMLSTRSNRLICSVSPAARGLIAILVLSPTTSCWLGDSVLGPDARVTQLTIVPAFSTQGLGAPSAVGPLAEVGSLGFIVRRTDGSIVVADTVAVDIESGRVEYDIEVTYDPPAETFTVELVLLDSAGDELFTGEAEYTISDDESSPSAVEVVVVYVGATGTLSGSVSVEGTGIDGVTVNLVGDLSLTTTTAGGGAYTFLDVWVGTYSVELSDIPPQFEFGTSPSGAVVDSDGQVVVDFVGAVAPPGSISGRVFRSQDDAPLEGVRVLRSGQGGDAETVTNATGDYEFAVVPAGVHDVSVENLPTFGSLVVSGAQQVTVTGALDVNQVDFAFRVTEVQVRTIASVSSADVAAEVEITVELDLSEVPLPMSGINGTIEWPTAIAEFVRDSDTAGNVWSQGGASFLTNQSPPGTLLFVGVSPNTGIEDDVFTVMTFRVMAVAAGSADFSPTVAELEMFDPGTGTSTKLLDIVFLRTTTAVVDFTGTVDPILVPPDNVVVFNDINIFVNEGMDAGVGIPNNHILVQNLVGFSSSGSRGTGTNVWWDIGRGSRCAILPLPSQCTPAGYSSVASEIVNAGLTIETVFSASGTLTDIPADVKVIFLWNPAVAYTVAEINALRQFAGEGGRVIFVGEHSGFYGTWIPIQNQFLLDMGAEMVNTGDAVDCE